MKAQEKLASLLGMIRRFLNKEVGPEFPSKRYVLAVSGGVDSMVLLSLFLDLVPRDSVVVAHLNHRTRGRRSDQDARWIAKQASKLGVAFVSGSRKHTGTSEVALRRERYAFLEAVRRSQNADFIVTAHHANDQLETFFMRLARGSGMDGLRGIAPQCSTTHLLRPMLKMPRSTIEGLANTRRLHYRDDETNGDRRFFRNRIRQELIPVWRKMVHSHGGETLFLRRFEDCVDEIRWAGRVLETKTRRIYRKLVVETPFWFRLSHESFLRLSTHWQARVLRRVFKKLNAEPPTRDQLHALQTEIRASKRASSGVGGIHMKLSCGVLFFSSEDQRKRLEEISSPEMIGIRVRLAPPFRSRELRFYRPGDVFGRTRLKKILLEKRVPQPERRLISVIAAKHSSVVEWVFPSDHQSVSVLSSDFPFSFSDR